MSEERPGHRLDPDRAASEAARARRSAPEPVIDTRPYRRMIGAIGIGIAIVISALLFITKGGVGTVGIPPGQTLHWFVAPLATLDAQRRREPQSALQSGAAPTPAR